MDCTASFSTPDTMFRQQCKDETMLTLHTETTDYDTETKDLYLSTSSSYRSTKRKIKTCHQEDIHALVMSANIQRPVAGEKTYRYTGFNEPFSHGQSLYHISIVPS